MTCDLVCPNWPGCYGLIRRAWCKASRPRRSHGTPGDGQLEMLVRHFRNLSMILALGLGGCGSLAQMDREMLGQPSPAVAMYAVQVQFAHNMCSAAGHVPDADASARFVTMSAVRGLALTHYKETYPEFSRYLAQSAATYDRVGASLTPDQRARFCQAYSRDVQTRKSAVGIIQTSGDFQKYFSPPSDAFLARSRKGAAGLMVLSAAATVGGIRQADRGNFDAAHGLNAAGGTLAGSVAEHRAAAYCPAYAPFANAPADSAVWQSYHSLQSCR